MTTVCLPEAGLPPTPAVPAEEAKPLVSTLHVQVTHDEIDELSADDLMVLCWLRRLSFAQGDALKIRREDLQLKIGWSAMSYRPRSGGNRVSHATGHLEAAGLIQIHQRHDRGLQRTLNAYTVAPRKEGRFEKVPYWLLDQLSAPELKGRGTLLLKHWLVWRKECGARGQCQKSIGEIAEATGSGHRLTKQVRQCLVDMGLLRSQDVSGFSRVTSVVGVVDLPTRRAGTPADVTPDITVEDGAGTAMESVLEPAGEGEGPLSEIVHRPRQESCTAPVSDRAHTEEYTTPKTEERDTVFGPQGRLREVSREDAAGKPPSHQHESTSTPQAGKAQDRFAVTARRFLRRCPQTAGLSGRTRGMLSQWLAARLRATPERDLEQTLAALASELELAEESAAERGRPFSHVAVMDQVLHRWFSDRIAAPQQQERRVQVITASGFDAPDWYIAGEGLTGPSLEDLAAQEMAADWTEPEAQLQACTTVLARLVMGELEADPWRDVEDAIVECRRRVRLQPDFEAVPGWLVSIAAKTVRAAWRVSYRQLLDDGVLDDAQEQDEAQRAAREWLCSIGVDPDSILAPSDKASSLAHGVNALA